MVRAGPKMIGVAGEDNGLAGFAAFFDAFGGVEVEVAFELFGVGAVAFVTALDKDGADFFFELASAWTNYVRVPVYIW